ncbi:MAG: penicillin-binding protein activator [Caulobacterales bacterium]
MKRAGSSSATGSASRPHSARIAASAALLALTAACASGPSGPPTPNGPFTQPSGGDVRPVGKPGLTPPFMAGRDITRFGLLLPFSAQPGDAEAFYNAAELALFDQAGPNALLMPRDVGADAASAENAARSLVRDGADIVIGPIRREQVAAAAPPARGANAPMIAFSSDKAVAGDGVYLLSFPLETEVERIAGFASAQGLRSFAILAPNTEYGRRVEQAFRAEITARQGVIVASQLYARGPNDATSANAAATAARSVAALALPAGVQAILIADGGGPLRAIGPALLQAGVDLRRVRLLGTGQWAGADGAAREPTLAGGWYPAPEPGARADFEQRYRTAYGKPAPRLASLAYDAVAISAALSRDQGRVALNRQALERQDGFLGSDGVFRFRRDGSIERGLAVLEVKAGTAAVVDPAPKRFAPGS